jgi:pseudaminic acid cytidylyltransferase
MIAIIPARGGSKRIPRKNIKSFFGTPILAHTINEIQNTELFSTIVVTTEDEEISQIASGAGAKVLHRDINLADDYTGTIDVIASAVKQLGNLSNLQKEIVCCIYPITPILNKEHVSKGQEILERERLDYVFTAKRFQSTPMRSLKLNSKGKSEMYFPENLEKRTQDLPDLYHDAALFYLGPAQSWIEKKPILHGNSKFIEVGKYETFDVDDEEDWKMMVNLYSSRKLGQTTIHHP